MHIFLAASMVPIDLSEPGQLAELVTSRALVNEEWPRPKVVFGRGKTTTTNWQ